jgi:hypothetical protein
MLKELLRLVELKNDYLERYLISTEDFIRHIEGNNVGNIELLSSNRESILGIISHLDEKVHALTESLPDKTHDVASSEMKNQLRRALSKKEELVQDILEVDEILIKCLHRHKHEVANQLNNVRELKSAEDGYAFASNK